MTDDRDPITRLVQACRPNESLAPDDPRYVNCDDVRGENLVARFERSLRRADPLKPEFKLFAGHRGVGKTSELLRLKQLLEKPARGRGTPRPFMVIFFDITDKLDPNDIDFPDLLALTAGEVQRQLREASIPGFSKTSQYLNRVWDDIKGALGKRVVIPEGEVDVKFAKLALEFRNQPNARAGLREAIERQSTPLLFAVNDLLTHANATLRSLNKGRRAGLVVIIDGLDKVVRRDLPDGGNTHDRLFIHRREQLASLNVHTIYTVPISLYYSPLSAQLEQTIGEFNTPMPMIRLRADDRSDVTPDTAGMRKMWEILEKRCACARVAIGDVFDTPETGRYLCEMTGGHPRHLMMFVQSAAGAVDALPITRDAAEHAVRNYANSLLREVPDAFWPKIRRFATPCEDIPKDEDHQRMLLLLHVFEYMNGRPWYEVNPVLRTLPKFDAD
ncbi:MAG: hypothetical protein V2A79_06130 [Planctomycetota bacterium]